MPQRIAIIGGPGSGKTTLINHLEELGHAVMHEISRDVTKKAQEEGIDQLFLEDPILFSKLLLEGRLEQFNAVSDWETDIVFFDRGLPDVPIYMDFIKVSYPEYFRETCSNNTYDAVFMLPPWKAIYQQDNERYESFEQAKTIYQFLKKGYASYGYDIIEIPTGTVEERITFLQTKLQNN
ncbi:AAA family ATPase [Jejudonia soesokkakensis]|uniref:AAA family ATPase n=1 Tax=Jejudonia soesokkakensis TaxID=1323432 RepID=A0ABW2MT32_9FLAO